MGARLRVADNGARLPFDTPEVQQVRRDALAWWIPLLGESLVCLTTLALDPVNYGGAITVATDLALSATIRSRGSSRARWSRRSSSRGSSAGRPGNRALRRRRLARRQVRLTPCQSYFRGITVSGPPVCGRSRYPGAGGGRASMHASEQGVHEQRQDVRGDQVSEIHL